MEGAWYPEYLETPRWLLLLLLPEIQTVFDVTEKLMFSARGLCLASPKAGRSKGEGPPGSRKVEGEVTGKKKKINVCKDPWAERNYFGKKSKTVCLEYRVRCVDWERAGQSGQRPYQGVPISDGEDFARGSASHGFYPSAPSSPLMPS